MAKTKGKKRGNGIVAKVRKHLAEGKTPAEAAKLAGAALATARTQASRMRSEEKQAA